MASGEGVSISELLFQAQELTQERYLAMQGIPASELMEYYDVEDNNTREVIHQFPTLGLLLGRVAEEPLAEKDTRPDGVERNIWLLTEGSGLFGLKNPEDAMRWKGIFNHVMGTTRQVYFLSRVLSRLTPGQQKSFQELGFDSQPLQKINPQLLRDNFMITHAGRRASDERIWHNLDDNAHPTSDPAENTDIIISGLIPSDPSTLTPRGVQGLIDTMKVEHHDYLESEIEQYGFLPDIVDNILTYCDWTFGQTPNTLHERFEGLRKSGRAPMEQLDMLQNAGKKFEDALRAIVDPDIFEQMAHAGPYYWETKIREAYCSPSGINPEAAFPLYYDQFPQLRRPV